MIVTVQVTVPDALDVGFLIDPGPLRWKLCSIELSVTVMSYVPGSRCDTPVPSGFFSEMLKPGPTTPVSVTLGSPVAAAGMDTAATATMPMSSVRNIRPSLRLLTRERAVRFYAGGLPATMNAPDSPVFRSER